MTETPDKWNDETENRIKTASEIDYFVKRLTPEPCDGLFLSDGSPWDQYIQLFIMKTRVPDLPLPDLLLLRTHYRIAPSLHLFYVEERIAEGWPSPILCCRLYPRSFTGLVHQLLLGMYAKECRDSRNEAEALQLVERHTSIPAPLWVDDYQDKNRVLIMTAMPGDPLDLVFHRLSYAEREQLSRDLRNVVSQIRCLSNRTSFPFGNSHGGPLIDHRFPSGMSGPFHRISDFNSFLVHCAVQRETKAKIAAVHSRSYRSVFAHADLHPSNILIERGRLSAIVDWECAGFYLEYWEFTKMMYGTQHFRPMESITRDVFHNVSYEEELEAEKLLWYDTPFGI
ncbi:hypothetical protein NUU61_000575 [Penicillium alfredii]|uniref:Aminoglycoside phosphotransferase domain-containing protein n=1 Tax=Penicillium alfredii TaxID=1506179 RepID=A0A9W9GA22_9EURO|nr:uncharacterized protein NUU61_000575 [Penicillium alfredii]KAJ5114816.1 hypothetical protein NUU61_000575 [Penicillium alfredii]